MHGGPTLLYEPHSAVAIELQGYVDAINNPAWGVDQICERPYTTYKSGVDFVFLDYPGKDFKWTTSYKFSVVK